MPVIKRRPHVSELLAIAVAQRQKVVDASREILERPANIWTSTYHKANSDDLAAGAEIPAAGWLPAELTDRGIVWSRLCQKTLDSRAVSYSRFLLPPVAFFVVAYAVQFHLSVPGDASDTAVYALDIIINIGYVLNTLLRVAGAPIRYRIEMAFNRDVEPMEMVTESGIIGLVLSLSCISNSILTTEGLWLRLSRLPIVMRSVLELLPHINMLMSGVSNGVRSITFTISLFFLLLLAYGALGHYLFAANDPYHFGSYALSFITLFHSATFENWSVVWYANYGGCDSFMSEYAGNVNATRVETSFGNFILPVCGQPAAQPGVSALFFVSFAFFGGYVSVSMSLAAVAIGVSERLDSLRSAEVFGEDKEAIKMEASAAMSGKSRKRSIKLGDSENEKVMKMMGSTGGKERRRAIDKLVRVLYEAPVVPPRRPSMLTSLSKLRNAFSARGLTTLGGLRASLSALGGDARTLGSLLYTAQAYEALLVLVVVADGVTHIVDLSLPQQTAAVVALQFLYQTYFSLNYLAKGMRLKRPARYAYLSDSWKVFDLLTVAVLWVPTISYSDPALQFINSVRILRLVLVAQYLSYMPDLDIIMKALASSFQSITYVVLITFIDLFFFAVAGVLLFRDADPFHFGSLGVAFRTLLQVTTLDNWSDVMRTCMYGCSNHGYSTGLPRYDDLCKGAVGVGWWSPIYFLALVISSAFVLISLFIAVIISSLQLLREELIETEDIWKKLGIMRRSYRITEHMVKYMLLIFEMLDANGNGYLAFKELPELFSVFGLPEELQFEVYMKVDRDGSGQIDFAEFCEMIMLLRMAQGEASRSQSQKSQASAAAESKRNLLGSIAWKSQLGAGKDGQDLGGPGAAVESFSVEDNTASLKRAPSIKDMPTNQGGSNDSRRIIAVSQNEQSRKLSAVGRSGSSRRNSLVGAPKLISSKYDAAAGGPPKVSAMLKGSSVSHVDTDV